MRSHGLQFRAIPHSTETSACRSDFELQLMLDDRHNWTVNGPKGIAFDRASTLRCALAAGLELSERGYEVVALVRYTPGSRKIVVLHEQMRILAALVERRPIFH
jgi:hypothetical protein